MSAIEKFFQVTHEVAHAIQLKMPVVALESTVITHGLPYPDNLSLAEDMENEVRSQGVTPATIGVFEGHIQVGMTSVQLSMLAAPDSGMMKISLRDFAPAIANLKSGGTTVAGTLFAASRVGIRVFATGGLGGVHYELNRRRKGVFDISPDLPALARLPMIVVCAGAKAILDLSATLEYLETWGVPVVGYQTDDFPAFYSRKSGFKSSSRADTPESAAFLAHTHWKLGMRSAVVVAAPPPEEFALPSDVVKAAVQAALKAAQAANVTGQALTPFLLNKVSEITHGDSTRANLALLLNNARIASQIARALARLDSED